jgi:nucleoid DNA-binding protein
MKQAELAREVARDAQLLPAEARDRVDELVHRIIQRLRRGQSVALPGLGKLVTRTLNAKETGRRKE